MSEDITQQATRLLADLQQESAANLEAFLAHYPDVTVDMLYQMLLSAGAIADTYSLDPSTKTGSLNFTPQGALRSVGVNNFPTGLAATFDRLNDRDYKKPATGHAEENSLNPVARFGGEGLSGNFNVSTLIHCAPCLNHIHGAGMPFAISNAAKINLGIIERYGLPFIVAMDMLREMKDPTVKHILLDIPAGLELTLGLDALYELQALGTGVAFAPAIPYQDLVAWGAGVPRVQQNMPILGVK